LRRDEDFPARELDTQWRVKDSAVP